MTDSDSYRIWFVCGNCGAGTIRAIPKGTRVHDFLYPRVDTLAPICRYCGVSGTLRRRGGSG